MRPISLLSSTGKLMERMVLARLKWQVGELHPSLFAFQSRRSTTTCLMTLLGTLRSRSGLVVFLDLEKAFEMASPPGILNALAEKGVRGHLLQWVRGFLTGRRAQVRFQGHLSDSHSHTLGTPQGSCLSPLLFNILMEGLFTIDYGHGVRLLCYADDLALGISGHCYQNRTPQALDRLQQRCCFLGLKINPEKTTYMTFGVPQLTRPLLLGDTPIRHATAHQYLGVWLDTSLSFRSQVSYLKKRAVARVQVLRGISRRGNGASVTVKRLFYAATIRSIIDYCAPCPPGLSRTLYQKLEVIQNDAMSAILGEPWWTKIVILREECGQPSIKHRILARTCAAWVQYLRRWPGTSLANQFLQALQRPPAITSNKD